MLWCAGALLALLLGGLTAMTALGPLLFGLSLIYSETRARPFRSVVRPVDLLAPGTALGEALASLDHAQADAHEEGAAQGLARRSEGFFFDDRLGGGADLNQRLARVLVARQQLAYEFEIAAAEWIAVTARRDVVRTAGLLFVCVILFLCAFEPAGAAVLCFSGAKPSLLRLAASAAGGGLALVAMRRASRWAEAALIARVTAASGWSAPLELPP